MCISLSGLSPLIAKPVAGSYDAANNVLTIIVPQVDKNTPYVNSKWEWRQEPCKGDVINSYNDGPLADGTQLGPSVNLVTNLVATDQISNCLHYPAIATYRQLSYKGNSY
jgi:hypothetical protein